MFFYWICSYETFYIWQSGGFNVFSCIKLSQLCMINANRKCLTGTKNHLPATMHETRILWWKMITYMIYDDCYWSELNGLQKRKAVKKELWKRIDTSCSTTVSYLRGWESYASEHKAGAAVGTPAYETLLSASIYWNSFENSDSKQYSVLFRMLIYCIQEWLRGCVLNIWYLNSRFKLICILIPVQQIIQ